MSLSRFSTLPYSITRSIPGSTKRARVTTTPPNKHSNFPHHRDISSSDPSSRASPLFRYTSGRWVYNESKRLQERERVFNCTQLQSLAARAVSRSLEDVVSIEKIGEGAANRAFAIVFRDGFRMVARVPYPSIEPKGLVVASEAATMTFLRSKGIPVPKVFSYSCSTDNPAGTEYIFMEFCSTTNLGSIWDDISTEDSTRLIQNLVTLEAQLSSIRLPASGSVYFLRDLPPDATKFAVDVNDTGSPSSIYLGPSTDIHFWFGKRKNLQVERGPFSEATSTMNAGALKEMHYLEKFGRPLLPFDRFQRETFHFQKQEPAVHLDSLRKYLQVSEYLVPRATARTRPLLRHPDLRPNNIFVSDDLDITAIIDWQHSTVLPSFLSAGVPDFLDPQLHPLSTPETEREAEEADHVDVLRQRHLCDNYLAMTERHNPSHFEALTHPFSIGRRKIHRLSCDPWHGDNVPLRSSLIFVKQTWRHISNDPTVPCPISFAQEEEEEYLRLDDAEQQGVQQLEGFKRTIGLGPEGWVSNEDYDAAIEAIDRMKELSLAQAESEDELIAIRDHWVFDDMDEEEYL